MKKLRFFKSDIQQNIKNQYIKSNEFKEDLISQNIQRGKLLAVIVITFEAVFISIDILSCIFQVNKSFSFYSYLTMYSIMIVINLIYLLIINGYEKKSIYINTMNIATVIFVTMIMVWGSIISLMDQRLYGQLMTFVINMITCSVIYYLDSKRMCIPYLISIIFMAVGLPFYQKSSDILIGHYVNLIVFVTISWTVSRIMYRNYTDNYVIKELMKKSSLLLAEEMKENTVINKKLELANEQLKKLALLDELTGLPNRRSFREFIEKKFENNSSEQTVSVIMIDIDDFKRYNDLYGHEKGDSALIAVANRLNNIPDNTDQIAIRWGGEEFIFVAFNLNQKEIIEIANDIRLKILELKIQNQESFKDSYLTVSLGTCTAKITSERNICKIIDKADQAMYLAKKNGRNCVVTLEYNESDFEKEISELCKINSI
ncbi:hypothetical protein SDC9_73020 [bioreactor metagenome]|uniref:GGDEF domain-containing protein n=1 Tax=bioreactor metagenome TaxID=1076179 RepID=A0A644YD86_9ZZZZ|nr:GGDEF domain-containing protein [Oscillospiraceae bacterium]